MCGKCRRFCKRIMGQTPSTEDVCPKFLLVSRTATLEKSYPSTQFLHRLLAIDLVPVDELHSPIKVSPPSSFPAHRMLHKFRFFRMMLVTFLGVWDIKEVCSSWAIAGNRRVHVLPYPPLPQLVLQNQSSQSMYEEVWIALFILHFRVPVNHKIV